MPADVLVVELSYLRILEIRIYGFEKSSGSNDRKVLHINQYAALFDRLIARDFSLPETEFTVFLGTKLSHEGLVGVTVQLDILEGSDQFGPAFE